MEKKNFIGDCGDPAEDARVVARYTEVGMHPERTVLVPVAGGLPLHIDEVDGNKWMVAFSERSDLPKGMKDVRVAEIGEILWLQSEAGIGEGVVLDPYTDPMWIPNGMIPILLDGGRTPDFPIPSPEEGKEEN